MKMRWLATGIAAVLITGGAATVAQRVITQKTRGVLPEINDAAHADSRQVKLVNEPSKTTAETIPNEIAQVLTPPEQPVPPLLPAPGTGQLVLPPDQATQPVSPTVAVIEESPLPIEPGGNPTQPPSTDLEVKPVGEPMPKADGTPEPTPVKDTPAKVDPVDAVETFVERNRKEAETAIQTLTSESEHLKARLIKVEAALTRWQNFSRALNADQPTSQTDAPPVTKAKWNRPDTEPSSRPIRPSSAADSPQPIPDLKPTEAPPLPQVSSPAEPTAPIPDELPQPEKPSTEPPPSLPGPKI